MLQDCMEDLHVVRDNPGPLPSAYTHTQSDSPPLCPPSSFLPRAVNTCSYVVTNGMKASRW